MPAMRMAHYVDPGQAIMNEVGSLDDYELFGNQVLLGVYVRPKVTAGGIHLADRTIDEDEWQGKVGVVLKKGPQAFVDDDQVKFCGQNVKVGDWVVCWVTDGRKLKINKTLCRVVKDTDIRLTVPAPDVVY